MGNKSLSYKPKRLGHNFWATLYFGKKPQNHLAAINYGGYSLRKRKSHHGEESEGNLKLYSLAKT